MHLHILSQDVAYVDCIERGPHVPMRAATGNEPSVPKPRHEWSDPDIEQVRKDQKAMNILFNGVDGDMFDNIINYKTATEMSRRPGQHRMSAPSGPGSSESDSDDLASERTLDIVAEETPMPHPPVPPVAPGGVSGPSARPRWVRRSRTERSMNRDPDAYRYKCQLLGISLQDVVPVNPPRDHLFLHLFFQDPSVVVAMARSELLQGDTELRVGCRSSVDAFHMRMPPKKNFPSNSSSGNSEGGPVMDGLLDLLHQQSN
ncbi:hypothetical protein AgCh_016737 [Apium graveolens]